MYTASELAKILRDNGCKVTPQRLAVYDMLSHTTEHPTAEMIYQKVKEQYPTMSFATVYKSVEIFSKLGVIQVLNTGRTASATMPRRVNILTSNARNVDASTTFPIWMQELWKALLKMRRASKSMVISSISTESARIVRRNKGDEKTPDC